MEGCDCTNEVDHLKVEDGFQPSEFKSDLSFSKMLLYFSHSFNLIFSAQIAALQIKDFELQKGVISPPTIESSIFLAKVQSFLL